MQTTGQLSSLKRTFGSRKTLPGLCLPYNEKDEFSLKQKNQRMALNMPLQGSCSDILKIVLSRISKEIMPLYEKYGFDIMNSIHDEINFSIPKRFFKPILSKIINIMERPVNFIDLRLNCSIYIGNNWGELVKY